MPGVPERIDGLLALLKGVGRLEEPVEQALRAVPRHDFIPALALVPDEEGLRAVNRDADPDGWWETVYADVSIVTQLDDGATAFSAVGSGGVVRLPAGVDYTSSASAPSTVVGLLNLLDAEPGHRVLEVGTGTGWTAALLSRLVGDGGLVVSVEIDPAVAEQAAKNLTAAGHDRVRLVVGDGTGGHPEDGPYDRVHVTCGVRTVPQEWVEQTRPGGVIVLPYVPGFGTGHELRLIVTPDGFAHGRFSGFASYMMMRSQRTPAGVLSYTRDHQATTTEVDPRAIGHAPAGADLAVAARTGLYSRTLIWDDAYRLWVYEPGTCHAAAVTWTEGRRDIEVRQYGDRPVWDEVVDAYFQWVGWGQPGRGRFGMTVAPDGQRVWLDEPSRTIG
ncbi:methyltransferase domain-containing protein [Streptosporangium jomthongense]|uniref:Protein-L-isoaspartate O-methyltransferase n=1 Tax=Streptosporangium jomthongense TaxID=1193683 RepID=A0ABV8FF95_9ACTN